MSEFKISGNITADNLLQGDGGQIVVNNAAVGELARTVQENADAVQQIEAALAQLQAEMASGRPRQARLRELLTTLTGGAGALTAMVEGIEKIQRAVGQ
ncbi:hypothetical protein [Paractinoplanes atraurantiacus]|uniref:Uncharacterized protein n=1 Tax=Paractinoplanes atraurantiacus TaxID=1036182 RepID=A0A285JY98_9ACTN|nr:hypothetical protein [Actinoplanes atraurantiacus]SNY65285.1 hypothetical protein SAMN05421748_12818 [Actinoplanes atraurantiacus]